MKIHPSKSQSERANILITAIVITAVAGFTLASFLTLATSQSNSIMRSQTWNASIPVLEAGIEEAMTHLNDNCVFTDIQHSGTNWYTDSWTSTGDGITKTTYLPDGSYYAVKIMTVAPYSTFAPAILSEGHVPAPLTAGWGGLGGGMFAVVGATVSSTSAEDVARKVKVTTSQDGVFAKGMVAKRNIDLNGNNIATDSFDSSDPAYSTESHYDPAKTRDHGDIATDSGVVNSIDVGNANIAGHISTGPGGSVAIGPNGKVGDKAWMADPGKSGIQPGHVSDDMNVSFPDVKVPFTGGYSTPLGPLTLTNDAQMTTTTTNTQNTYPEGQSPVVTNTTTVTTTSYPSPGTYLGTPGTNTAQTTTVAYPASGTYLGVVLTNTTTTTGSGYPSGNYVGSPSTNLTVVTNASAPAAGSYVGAVTTNLVSTTTASYPGAGTYLGSVTTNSASTTTTDLPAAGTYLGSITTNCSSSKGSSKDYPAAGAYCGTPWQTGQGNNNSSAWNWYLIASYTYNKISGYGYSAISSYTYSVVSGYTYEQISTYTYNQITGYTWAQIVSYSYYTTTTTTGSAVVTTYDWVLDNGNFKLSDFSGNVLVRGHATLYVTDSVNFTGHDGITINPSASLKLYVGAPSAKIAGNGVWNASGNATNFFYYGLPGNTALSLSGNGQLTGVIYAPEAAYTLNGGGNDVTDFIGASVTDTVKLNGHFNFHYDESLNKYGPGRGYVIKTWDEVPLVQHN